MPAQPKPQPERAAFCAGITPNADDPMSLAIHGLIDHAAKESRRVDRSSRRSNGSARIWKHMPTRRLDLRRLSAVLEGKSVEQGVIQWMPAAAGGCDGSSGQSSGIAWMPSASTRR